MPIALTIPKISSEEGMGNWIFQLSDVADLSLQDRQFLIKQNPTFYAIL